MHVSNDLKCPLVKKSIKNHFDNTSILEKFSSKANGQRTIFEWRELFIGMVNFENYLSSIIHLKHTLLNFWKLVKQKFVTDFLGEFERFFSKFYRFFRGIKSNFKQNFNCV